MKGVFNTELIEPGGRLPTRIAILQAVDIDHPASLMRNGARGHEIDIERQFGPFILQLDLPGPERLSNAGGPIKPLHIRTKRRVIGEAANVIAQAVWAGIGAGSGRARHDERTADAQGRTQAARATCAERDAICAPPRYRRARALNRKNRRARGLTRLEVPVRLRRILQRVGLIDLDLHRTG